ncbi:hypothetical protein [Bradyrhizobium sp. McL0616]|uniref:hypothetical protein n=1 Tax=Bradyrhizobium sp. McL0616 TaxID=3415674 RepID=UPI003CF7FA17
MTKKALCLHRVCKSIADLSAQDRRAIVARDYQQASPLKRQRALPGRQIQADAPHARELVDVMLILPHVADRLLLAGARQQPCCRLT